MEYNPKIKKSFILNMQYKYSSKKYNVNEKSKKHWRTIMENNNFAEFLEDISQQDLSKVGGKAANLGEMIGAGLPVPEGFVLVVDAYEKFIEFNKIKIRIEKLLMNLETKELEDIEKVSCEIKGLFEEGEIPTDLLCEIYDFYEKMCSPEVVVRSSSTMEDSPATSFAGQYDSFLNVNGKKQLQESIKHCWASLWNTRALSYRLKQKIDGTKLAHAVIIQKQISAEKSGILFTVNPLNNRRDQMLINSSWGMGDAIVSGDVIPDQWIVHKKNHEMVEEKIAVKNVMTIRKNEGTKLGDVPQEKVKQPSLEKREIHDLLKLGKTTEDHFDCPQDIEWSFYEDKIYLVQSRPITTLFPKLKPEDKSEELRIYTNFLLIDKVMPEPLTPIGRELWMKTLTNLFPNQWVKHAGGRLFVDTTELGRLEKWWDNLRSNPSAMDPETIKTTLEVLERNENQLKQQRKSLIKIIPNMIFGINPSFYKFLLTSSLKVQYSMLFSSEKVVEKAHIFGEKQIKSLEEKSKNLHTIEEKIKFIEQNILAVFYFIPLQTLFYVVNSLTYLEKAKTIIRKYQIDTSQLHNVEKSLPNNVTTEMGMELLRIAQKIDQSGEHPSPKHPEIKKFLNKYGHRTYLEIDPGVSRWKENPEYIITLIQSYIKNKSYDERIKKYYMGKEEAEETIQDITMKLKEKGAYKDARKVEKILTNYRKLFGTRELPKYIMIKGVSLFREILLEMGEELVAQHRIDTKQDIFFVNFKDIKSGKKLQRLVLQHQEEYQKELKRISVPRVMTSTGETVFSPDEFENGNEFRGIPVSPGIKEGRVKILKHPEEGNKLKKGDILITKATNPSWTPLFLKIGGLITEMGGPISHGSVIAREYGIPAIAGLNEATSRFKDKQLIRLNGETGKVEIL